MDAGDRERRMGVCDPRLVCVFRLSHTRNTFSQLAYRPSRMRAISTAQSTFVLVTRTATSRQPASGSVNFVADGIDNLELHDLTRQQAQRPVGIPIRSRT